MRLASMGVGLGVMGATLVVSLPARAQDGGAPAPADVIASYCADDDELRCTVASIGKYSAAKELPIAFDWDTGWIPGSSPIQVRFYVKLPAATYVALEGWFETTWPEAMTIVTPGARNSGFLQFDYGLEIGAKARIDTKIAGIPIKWTGDIPYVPQVDFHLKGANTFDSWAFAPDVASARAVTDEVRLFEVNVLALAGIPDQISKGGVVLNLRGELEATYETRRIMIEPSNNDGEDPVLSATDEVYRAFPGGAFVEYDVWPEGVLTYDGTVLLLPKFFIEVLGARLEIPTGFDFPLTVPLGEDEVIFDPIRVHVPLPDIEPRENPVVDFGEVVVGSSAREEIDLSNVGEAQAKAKASLVNTNAFRLLTPSALIDPSQVETLNVRFAPQQTGFFEAELNIISNDPDLPLQTLILRGVGVGQGSPNYDGGGPSYGGSGGSGIPSTVPSSATLEEDGGCACGTAGRPSEQAPWAFGLLGIALISLRRRRRALLSR